MGILDTLRANVVLVLLAALSVAAGVAMVQSVRLYGLKVGPVEITGYVQRVADLEAALDLSREALTACSDAREKEAGQNRQAYAGQTKQCEAQIKTTRAATRIIEGIVHAPVVPKLPSPADDLSPDRCLRGPLIAADRLRIITGQTGERPPGGVPGGPDGGGPGGTDNP